MPSAGKRRVDSSYIVKCGETEGQKRTFRLCRVPGSREPIMLSGEKRRADSPM